MGFLGAGWNILLSGGTAAPQGEPRGCWQSPRM